VLQKLLINIIRLYQVFFPKKYRGKCLYKESCSNHVLRITRDKGLAKGLKALTYRYKNCRPNYYLTTDKSGNKLLITASNEVVEEKDIDDRLL